MESLLFFVKKVLGYMLMPVPLFWFCLCLAGLCALVGRARLRNGLIVVALAWIGFFSLPSVAHWVARPLEQKYPMYGNQPVDFVVVHGNAHVSDPLVPITSLLSEVALMRLAEGIRIHRLNPNSKLLLSGYSGGDAISQAEAMAQVAEQVFSVSREDMILKPLAKDTEEEAEAWVEVTAGRPLAVVTSAVHMPRTLFLYHHLGSQPIAAPTQYDTRSYPVEGFFNKLPSGSALRRVERAWHEYVGLLWLKVKGY